MREVLFDLIQLSFTEIIFRRCNRESSWTVKGTFGNIKITGGNDSQA